MKRRKKSVSPKQKTPDNRRLVAKLLLTAVLMFGFGYALVPIYDALCRLTGLNGKTQQAAAETPENADIDKSRWVTVEFTSNVYRGMPWEFRPKLNKIRVHPGELTEVHYYARNTADETIVGQASPSVAPSRAAAHFKKIECFCFTRQGLKAGELREMPVRFVVDTKLPADVRTVTLSYTFFNTDEASAKKYGGDISHEHAGHQHEAHLVVSPAGS